MEFKTRFDGLFVGVIQRNPLYLVLSISISVMYVVLNSFTFKKLFIICTGNCCSATPYSVSYLLASEWLNCKASFFFSANYKRFMDKKLAW